jgi:hypothetical protein
MAASTGVLFFGHRALRFGKKNSPIGGADALPERMISRCVDE